MPPFVKFGLNQLMPKLSGKTGIHGQSDHAWFIFLRKQSGNNKKPLCLSKCGIKLKNTNSDMDLL